MGKFLRYFFLVSLLIQTACHFHLRGIEEVPIQFHSIALKFQNVSPEWRDILTTQLQRAHATVLDAPQSSAFLLTILQEDIQRNIMSVSSGSSSREYQLIYKVVFSFEKIKGPIYLSDASVLVTRFLTINNDRILGSQDEEEKIIHNMRQDAAIQIMYRLNALSQHSTL